MGGGTEEERGEQHPNFEVGHIEIPFDGFRLVGSGEKRTEDGFQLSSVFQWSKKGPGWSDSCDNGQCRNSAGSVWTFVYLSLFLSDQRTTTKARSDPVVRMTTTPHLPSLTQPRTKKEWGQLDPSL